MHLNAGNFQNLAHLHLKAGLDTWPMTPKGVDCVREL